MYPWTQQFVNTLSGADVTRGSTFPDVDPSSLPRHAQFSMAAGDFLEVFYLKLETHRPVSAPGFCFSSGLH